MKKNNKGFSLVELIVVIAIMAILVAVLAPTLISKIEESREGTDVQVIGEVRQAVQTALGTEAIYDELVPAKDATEDNAILVNKAGTVTTITPDVTVDKTSAEIQKVIGEFEFKSKELKGDKTVGIKVTITNGGKVNLAVPVKEANADAGSEIKGTDDKFAITR